jgi:hypothetical protein
MGAGGWMDHGWMNACVLRVRETSEARRGEARQADYAEKGHTCWMMN